MTERDTGQMIADLVQAAAPLAIVWRRWMFGQNVTDWAAVMRSPNDQNRIHGWMIRRSSLPSEEQMSDHVLLRPRYEIFGVHWHAMGTDADNSYDKFQDELDAIVNQFGTLEPTAEINADDIQFIEIGMANSGAELVHFALAELTLQIC